MLLYLYFVAPHVHCLQTVRTPLQLLSYLLPTTFLYHNFRLSILLKAFQHMPNVTPLLSILIIHATILSDPPHSLPHHGVSSASLDADFSFSFYYT
jgi:hypothetical protein